DRQAHPRVLRRGSGQRAQRGGSAHRPREREGHRQPDPGRSDRPRHCRSAEADPADERQGAPRHRLPRGRTCARGRGGEHVRAGPQKRTRLMNDKERLVTAYHEGGHALVAAAMNQTDPVTKVTILPRGRALGYTMVLPSEDKYSTTRNELLDQLAYAMGGRVAEEIVFHDPTTGASNDIEKATNIARKMVTQYGMSEKLGMVKIGDDQSEPFAGRGYGGGDEYGDSTLSSIDR